MNAPAIRSKAPLRGGPEGPDPNAVRDLRCVLRFAVHVHRVACAGGGGRFTPVGAWARGCADLGKTHLADIAACALAHAIAPARTPKCTDTTRERTLAAPPDLAQQPKWEQAVRSVLRKDEHVVFGVIGFWVVTIKSAQWYLKKDDE